MSALQKKRLRPQLTLRIFIFALVDVVGMLLMSVAAVHFIYGPGTLFKTFPGTTGEALVTLALGVGIMLWAAANILREMMKQPQLTGDEDAR